MRSSSLEHVYKRFAGGNRCPGQTLHGHSCDYGLERIGVVLISRQRGRCERLLAEGCAVFFLQSREPGVECRAIKVGPFYNSNYSLGEPSLLALRVDLACRGELL